MKSALALSDPSSNRHRNGVDVDVVTAAAVHDLAAVCVRTANRRTRSLGENDGELGARRTGGIENLDERGGSPSTKPGRNERRLRMTARSSRPGSGKGPSGHHSNQARG